MLLKYSALIISVILLVGLSVSAIGSIDQNNLNVQFDRALATGQNLDRVRSDLAAQADRSSAAYRLGLLALIDRDQAAVDVHFGQALRSDFNNLLSIRAQVPIDLNLAQLAVQLYPDRSMAWQWLGDALVINQPQTALSAYQQAAQLDPQNNLAWESLGGLAEGQGDAALAVAAYQRACDLQPIRNGSCLSAARLAYVIGEWSTVIDYDARGGHPEQVQGWVQLIVAERKLGRTADADRDLARAQKDYPADYPKLLSEEK